MVSSAAALLVGEVVHPAPHRIGEIAGEIEARRIGQDIVDGLWHSRLRRLVEGCAKLTPASVNK